MKVFEALTQSDWKFLGWTIALWLLIIVAITALFREIYLRKKEKGGKHKGLAVLLIAIILSVITAVSFYIVHIAKLTAGEIESEYEVVEVHQNSHDGGGNGRTIVLEDSEGIRTEINPRKASKGLENLKKGDKVIFESRVNKDKKLHLKVTPIKKEDEKNR